MRWVHGWQWRSRATVSGWWWNSEGGAMYDGTWVLWVVGRFVVVVAGFSSSWCGALTMAKIDRWGLLVVGSKGFGLRVTFWWHDMCGY